MTNSPPAKVNISDYQILSSGIDTFYLSLDVTWNNEDIFNYLETLKEEAKISDKEVSGIFKTNDGSQEWIFIIKPHGSKGFAFILISKDYTLKIGKWLKPQSRPNILVEIRSETLWRMGTKAAVEWMIRLITGIGASIKSIKPSRVDFCVDIVLPAEMWTEEIKDYAVTRAKKKDTHDDGAAFTGISIGRGSILARIYDKGKEINLSKKPWMLDVWGIDEIPIDKRIVRVENQLRREALKSLGIEKLEDLYEMENRVWVYLTTSWLKFQDRPGTHHNQRETLEWWKIVQGGYKGSQEATPAVRHKAFKVDKRRLAQQMYGLMTSLQAADLEEKSLDENHTVTLEDCLQTFIRELINIEKSPEDLNIVIKRKRPKYRRVIN
ncbi:MAG: hypothetical protein LLG43_11670 [Deltaproteobacteria bacterium]|nr:hypothetical protein [Deltaproteobacteria bacterium]